MSLSVQETQVRRIPGGENGNPLQYSCLGNPTDRGDWCVTVHGVAKSWIQHSNWVCTHAIQIMPLPINNHIKPGHRNLLHSALSHHHNWSSSPSKKGGSQNRENDQLDGSHWGFSQPSDLPVVSEIVRHTTGNGCPMSVPGGSCCQQWPLNPSSSFPPKAPDLKIGQASEKTAWIMWSKQERDGGLEGNLPYCISIPKKKRKSLKKGRGWRNSTEDAPSPGTKKNRIFKEGIGHLKCSPRSSGYRLWDVAMQWQWPWAVAGRRLAVRKGNRARGCDFLSASHQWQPSGLLLRLCLIGPAELQLWPTQNHTRKAILENRAPRVNKLTIEQSSRDCQSKWGLAHWGCQLCERNAGCWKTEKCVSDLEIRDRTRGQGRLEAFRPCSCVSSVAHPDFHMGVVSF